MSKPRAIHIVNKAAGEIILYGYIGSNTEEGEVDYKSFREDFEAIAKTGKVTLRINSGGGSMIEGLAMFDLIRNSEAEVTGIVEGMAASMAGVLLQACDKRVMTANSRLMIHRASAGVAGDADALEAMVSLLRQEEEKIVAVYSQRSGKDAEEVKTWMQSGIDKWMDAKEALKLGLIDEIAPTASKAKLPKNVTAAEAVEIYNKYLNFEQEDTMKKPIIDLLNRYEVKHTLTSESTDKEVEAAVETALKNKSDLIADLTNKLAEKNKQSIAAVLQNAIDTGRIVAENKASWEKVLEADFEHGKAAIEGLSPRVDVNNLLNKGEKDKPGASDTKAPRADWTIRDWEKKDPSGLMQLKATNPEAYNTLFKNYYGN